MITPRLKMILKYVKGSTAADIGTDHAYIPIELAKSGMRVIASDISKGPLLAARENVQKSGQKADLRLGGGLTTLNPGEADTIIIAGMGGEMIEKILRESPEVAKGTHLLLQPMNSQAELRKFLIKNGYKILGEDLAKEGHKIYNLIIASTEGVCGNYSQEIDYHLPKSLYDNPLFEVLLAKKEREFTKIYNGLTSAVSADEKLCAEYKALLTELLKIKGKEEQKNADV